MAAKEEDLPWVREFFELFKTPWEVVAPGKHYDVVLSATDHADTFDADLAMVYGATELPIDRRSQTFVERICGPANIRWRDQNLPIYGRSAIFSDDGSGLVSQETGASGYRRISKATTIQRIGYNLFEEISYLLTRGQPESNAETPTLELHIALIRQCIEECGISYLEIPARPYQCAFICCLTHDVDFFGIRRHIADRTLAGFVWRGTVGTLVDVVRGRRPLDEAIRNWLAVLSLPLVLIGLKRDFWQPFDDYTRAEPGRGSTFFLIPFKGCAGEGHDGAAPAHRASPYDLREIRKHIQVISRTTTEFAVHGIDAWRDSKAGRAELTEVAAVTGQQAPGIRMHWLYFSDHSPKQLEQAGFSYDSTWGYNADIGYRAGTSQAFRLPGTKNLFELPLTIMDSALFYADRMGLDRQGALKRCRNIVRHAREFGGALVINWHDRSLAPERQWGRFYQQLLGEMCDDNVWFATAGQAVDWFRWRRSIGFLVQHDPDQVLVEAPPPSRELPPACLVVHRRGVCEMESKEYCFTGEPQTLTLGTSPVCAAS